RKTGAAWSLYDEELTAVGIRSGIGHGQGPELVRRGHPLIGKPVAGSASARPSRVPGLDHKPLDDPMKDHVIVIAVNGEKDKVVHRVRRQLTQQIYVNQPFGRIDRSR